MLIITTSCLLASLPITCTVYLWFIRCSWLMADQLQGFPG